MEEQNNTTQQPQVIYVERKEPEKNSIGLAGFILSLVALFASVLPVARWIVWVLGLIFSIIGLSKKPRGFAVAGLIISGVSLLLILLLLGVLAALIAGVASTLA